MNGRATARRLGGNVGDHVGMEQTISSVCYESLVINI